MSIDNNKAASLLFSKNKSSKTVLKKLVMGRDIQKERQIKVAEVRKAFQATHWVTLGYLIVRYTDRCICGGEYSIDTIMLKKKSKEYIKYDRVFKKSELKDLKYLPIEEQVSELQICSDCVGINDCD